MTRVLLVALGLLLLAPGVATAGPPIMPLSEVRPGMRCTGLSVVKGTEISSFSVVIEDIVGGDRGADSPRLLVRVSGPAVDATGIGPGFSGSPVVCDGRIAGAISESVGDYGGDVALATPIERVLGERADPPPGDPVPTPSRRRSLAGPLTVTGLSGPVAAAVRKATRGRVVAIAPSRFGRAVSGAPANLQPGSAFGVGLASGDLSAGAIGTVAYVDGDRVWGLGHPLDSAGRRSLLLQEAYVYTVVGNPVSTEDATTYKLAAPTRDVGTITNDAIEAVVGRTGSLPPRIAMRTIATDRDTGRRRILELDIADEAAIGLPAGQSALSAVAPIAVAQAAYTALRGTPVRVTSRMCATFVLARPKHKLKLCNRYVGGGGGSAEVAGAPAASDLSQVGSLIDAYDAGPLRIERLRVQLDLRRGLKLARLTSVRGPRVVRRGQRVTLRLGLRAAYTGRRFSRSVRVRVPRSAPRGRRDLVLLGTPADEAGASGEQEIELDLDALDLAPEGPLSGPRTFDDLRSSIRDLERWDGVRGQIVREGEDAEEDEGFRAVLVRDFRIDGEARHTVRVR